MIKIEEGIVFSNDIKRIMEGNNPLDFSYNKRNIIIPSKTTYEEIRKNFKNETQKIFPNITIISEEEMIEGLNDILTKYINRYPHCIIR